MLLSVEDEPTVGPALAKPRKLLQRSQNRAHWTLRCYRTFLRTEHAIFTAASTFRQCTLVSSNSAFGALSSTTRTSIPSSLEWHVVVSRIENLECVTGLGRRRFLRPICGTAALQRCCIHYCFGTRTSRVTDVPSSSTSVWSSSTYPRHFGHAMVHTNQ